MRVWVLEKIWLNQYGYVRSACYAFLHGYHAHSAMVDDFKEEYIARDLHSPPDENTTPFDTDDDASLVLPDGGCIVWSVHETEIEVKQGENNAED